MRINFAIIIYYSVGFILLSKDIMDYKIIRQLRKEHNWTQDQVAEMLWVSRVTYNLIENWRTSRDPYIDQFQDIFDVSFSALECTNIQKEKSVDVNIYEKSKELILYIISKTSQLPNVWKTVLYKMLYFCEFDWFEETWERFTWMDFIKLPKWPAPQGFDFMINKMFKDNEIIPVNARFMWYTQQRYLINRRLENVFIVGEKQKFVDSIIDRFKEMNASEISEYSHWDIPWKVTSDMNVIDINLVNSRMYPYSVKARKMALDQDLNQLTNNPAFSFLLDEEDLYEDVI